MKRERINFYKNCKLNVLCGNDELRPLLDNLMFFDNKVWATDAHLMVCADVQAVSNLPTPCVEMLNGKCIHKDIFKILLAYDEIIPMEDKIQATKYKTNTVHFYNYTDISTGEKSEQSWITHNMKPVMDKYSNLPISHIENIDYSISEIMKFYETFGYYDSVHMEFRQQEIGAAEMPYMFLYPYYKGHLENEMINAETAPIIGLLVGYLK